MGNREEMSYKGRSYLKEQPKDGWLPTQETPENLLCWLKAGAITFDWDKILQIESENETRKADDGYYCGTIWGKGRDKWQI